MTGGAAARPRCEHHWVSKHQPDFPREIYWIEVCSMCGWINGEALHENVREIKSLGFVEPHDAWVCELFCENYQRDARRSP